jgi:hypothetical protein
LIGLPLPERQVPYTPLLLLVLLLVVVLVLCCWWFVVEEAEPPPVERLEGSDGGGADRDDGPPGGARGDELCVCVCWGGRVVVRCEVERKKEGRKEGSGSRRVNEGCSYKLKRERGGCRVGCSILTM